ncbi:aldehyde dehydrogenase family protein [Clostridiaceae bacterium 35-E11]
MTLKDDWEEQLQKEYHLFINGQFKPSESGDRILTRNPANGEMLAFVSVADEKDVDQAVEAAQNAFEDWKATSAQERANILLRLADRVEENLTFLAIIESLDNGKPLREAREDMMTIADQFRYFAGCIRSQEGRYIQHNQAAFSILIHEPLGVIAQIVPWNFPLLIAVWKIVPALAAGNTVVIKPASNTPLSILEFARLTQDILPPGVLNVIPGLGTKCGEALLKHRNINKITFTGSTEVGKHIGKIAAESILPTTLELGGKSANIIFPDAPIKKAIEGAAIGILYNQGQVCSAGSRLFVHEEVYDEVIEGLKKIFMEIKIGDPLDPDVQMGPLIDEKQLQKVLAYVEIGKKEGATLIYGGQRVEDETLKNGFYIQPTLFTNVTNDMKIAQEEIFGPVLVVIKFREEQEVIDMANHSPYGLVGAVWSKDINRAIRVAKSIDTGTMWINEFNLVPAHSPFGGYKKSGYGRESHKMALKDYSQVKNIYISLTEEPTGWYKKL